MLKINVNDLPLKSINTSGFNGNVVVTLSSPYFISPSTIQVGILQISNPNLVAGVSWRILPIPETELPQLNTTTNSVSFVADYNIPSLVVELTVTLKDGSFQYYHVPVVIDDVPPFESACEHDGTYLEIHTNQNTVRFDIDGISTGNLDLIGLSGDADLLYEDSTIMLKYYSSLSGVYSNIISIESNSSNSNYTSKSIKFYPGDEDPYAVRTDLSNFPFIFDEGFTTEIDLSSLPYDYSEYFLATNCCFSFVLPA